MNSKNVSNFSTIKAMNDLLVIANNIVKDSTSEKAENFDTERWLNKWVEVPQPALGGKKPSELLSTPEGVAAVTKVLGAINSGSYQ